MKKTKLLIVLIATFLLTLHSFAQENSTANNNEVKKYSYQFMGEMFYPKTGFNFHFSDLYSEPIEWSGLGLGFHFINSMVYKEKIAIGLGIGWEWTIFFLIDDMGFPIFADFKYYFTTKKSFRPFIDVGTGTIITLCDPFSNSRYVKNPDFYFNCTGGFKSYHFQFHAGINIRTDIRNIDDVFTNNLSLNLIIKCGFNF